MTWHTCSFLRLVPLQVRIATPTCRCPPPPCLRPLCAWSCSSGARCTAASQVGHMSFKAQLRQSCHIVFAPVCLCYANSQQPPPPHPSCPPTPPTGFDGHQWYQQLFDYGMPQDPAALDPNDPDANLVPQLVLVRCACCWPVHGQISLVEGGAALRGKVHASSSSRCALVTACKPAEWPHITPSLLPIPLPTSSLLPAEAGAAAGAPAAARRVVALQPAAEPCGSRHAVRPAGVRSTGGGGAAGSLLWSWVSEDDPTKRVQGAECTTGGWCNCPRPCLPACAGSAHLAAMGLAGQPLWPCPAALWP